jgi:hypothetical protein
MNFGNFQHAWARQFQHVCENRAAVDAEFIFLVENKIRFLMDGAAGFQNSGENAVLIFVLISENVYF